MAAALVATVASMLPCGAVAAGAGDAGRAVAGGAGRAVVGSVVAALVPVTADVVDLAPSAGPPVVALASAGALVAEVACDAAVGAEPASDVGEPAVGDGIETRDTAAGSLTRIAAPLVGGASEVGMVPRACCPESAGSVDEVHADVSTGNAIASTASRYPAPRAAILMAGHPTCAGEAH